MICVTRYANQNKNGSKSFWNPLSKSDSGLQAEVVLGALNPDDFHETRGAFCSELSCHAICLPELNYFIAKYFAFIFKSMHPIVEELANDEHTRLSCDPDRRYGSALYQHLGHFGPLCNFLSPRKRQLHGLIL